MPSIKTHIPNFRTRVPTGTHSFYHRHEWDFSDRPPQHKGPDEPPLVAPILEPYLSCKPFLTLVDHRGWVRNLLGWEQARPNEIVITTLQQNRTEYVWSYGPLVNSHEKNPPMGHGWKWHHRKETRSKYRLQNQLFPKGPCDKFGMIHPSEFLFLEFLYRMLSNNTTIRLLIPSYLGAGNYSYIFENYCDVSSARVETNGASFEIIPDLPRLRTRLR